MATYPTYTYFPTGVSAGPGENIYNAATNTAGFTATAAQIQGPISLSANAYTAPADFVVLDLTGTLAGAANIQLPTVASLLSAFGGVAFSYILRVVNHSGGDFAWTVTTNTGWTLNGTMSIAQNTSRDFMVTVLANGTATLQQIGTGSAG